MSADKQGGALEGLRVLDLTRVLAGPLCAQILGDMGADVIKIEPPGTGDDTRSWGPPFTGGESAYFVGLNRNKRSVTLNMAAKAGQEILAELLKRSDVLVENFKLGTLEKWGFGNDWLEKNAPQLIRCSITGYGSKGPDAGLPGYDFILQAESGLMSICGEPEGTPTKYGVAIVDVVTGLYACNTILGALAARNRTGRGQHVEVCLYDSGIAMLINVASNYLVSGKDARRFGNGHPNVVPYTTYPTADTMIAVAVGNDAQFARFSETAGHPEWAASIIRNTVGFEMYREFCLCCENFDKCYEKLGTIKKETSFGCICNEFLNQKNSEISNPWLRAYFKEVAVMLKI